MSALPHEQFPESTSSLSDLSSWQLEGGDAQTNLAELLRLHAAGRLDEFDDQLSEIVFESFADDRLFMGNIRRIHDKSTPKQEQESIREAQRRAFEGRKKAILQEIGIEAVDDESQFEQKREAIQKKFQELQISGNESEDDILRILGVIDTNENGQESFTYPKDLFPDSTNEKWDAYLGSVKAHIQKSREYGNGMLAAEDVELADRTRRVAHNAVSRDVDKLFGLDLLPESSWSFEKTRRLVMKMRERRFPTINTAEEHVTTRAVASGLAAAAALAAKHEAK